MRDRGIRRTDGDVMLLDLPDVRQRDGYDCGPAAIDCALAFLGVRTCAHVLGLANPVHGTAPDTVEALLRRADLPVLSGEMTLADLRHFARGGRPVLCPVALHGGHWVVVRGVERGSVHYHCPLNGRQKMPRDEWLVHWRDDTTRGVTYSRWGLAVG